ncbi:MBG domain-containing protein [Selenomonas sp. ND2010]|uniref:MBG domain-containing protein n=1 Tax=Selenomonas sp. ND2010 TaxID=1410618 RepID=UPI00051B7A5B|nr:MBG domain-containing protein [Selenomonas sp. ND2010]
MRITRKRRRAAAKRQQRKDLLARRIHKSAGFMAAGAMMLGGVNQAMAMPQNGQVAAGAAEIARRNAEMAINQHSQNAVINWQSFNIGAGERVNIFQPNSQAALLNRVMDGNATKIMGALQANGRVFVVNPAGILFARGAQVNVGSLIASTLDISNADFMAGRYAFVSQKDSGKVINKGELIAKNKGLVALLGKDVENDGVIVAKKGTVALASGDQITLDFNGDGKVAVVPDKDTVKRVITNKGLVEADGGLVFLSAAAGTELTNSVVNQEGIIRAQSLDGDTGKVQLTADSVRVKDGSTIDVSGDNGGKVEIGGGWQGSGSLTHAKNVNVEDGASIKADARADNGNGGEVVVWSDGKTSVHGNISAKGKGDGDGGKVETSGHELCVTGRVSAASEQGRNGQWLLDPYNVEITDGGAQDEISGHTYTAVKSESKIANTVVNQALQTGTNVKISTGTAAGGDDGDIVIDGAITSSGKNATLSLEAARDIIINKDITGDKLSLDFKSNSGNGGKFMGGKITQAASSTIATGGGSVYFHGGNKDDMARATVAGESGIQLAGTITTAGGNITLHGATNEKNADGVQITGKVDAGAGKFAILAHNEAGGNGLAYDGTMSAKDMQLTMDTAKGSGTITSTADADGNKGTLSIQTETKNAAISLGSGVGLNITNALLGGGFATTQIGAADNAGTIQVGSAVSTTGDLTLYGGSIAVGAALTSDKNISLKAIDKITGTAAGKVTAEVLDVETKGDVQLSTDVAILKGKANSFDITNTSTSSMKPMTLGAEDMKLTAAKDISIKSSGILTSVAGAISSAAGDIALQADSFALTDDSIQGKGKLTIDTLTAGKSFGVGGAAGDVELAGVGFAAAGFSAIQFGSQDTGAIRIGTLNVNDAVSFTSGSSITVEGQVTSNGKDMTFTAGGADGFQLETGSVLEAGAADIAIQADKLTLSGAFSTQNTGTLSFSRKSTDAYTIGGNDASSYITDESLQKINDTFKNVIIGTESGGAVTLADITKPPAYLTVKSGSTATVTGTVKANSLVLAAKEGIQENGGSIKAESLLLQGGKADLTGVGNEIQNLAADVSGALAVNSSADMTIGQVEDRNAEKVVKKEGITTKGGSVKITMDADKKLTMGTIDAGSANITISADSIAKGTSTGKVTTSGKVQLYTTTAEKTIAIDTEEHAGAMNITSDSFAKGAFSNSYGELIIGRRTDEQDGSSQQGKVIIKHTNFSSKTTVRTENQVEFADSNIVGGDLTVHATGLQLDKESTTDIKNHNLNLNLTDSLDLGEGVINGSGKLNITTPEGKNIYLGGTDFAMPAAEDNGYKIGYGTVNSNLTGFSDFGITTKENVYLYAGGIDKSVKIAGAKGIHVVEDVTLGSADPAAATELTLNSAAGTIDVAAGKTLTINGANTVVNAAAKEIKLAAGAKIEAKAEMAGAAAGKGGVTLTADALELGTNAKIDGGAGSFTLQTDKLTVDRADSVTNIEGKGKLTLATKSAAAKMFVENELTTAENGLHVTAADINGGVFGAGFTELSLGNEKGTGTLTIDSVALKNSLTLQNGSSGAIVFQGKNSVAAGQAVTLKAGSIRNADGGSFAAESGQAGASQLNIYTNDLSQLTGTGGKTILGTGTLGLSTYDGTTAIHITKDAQAGGLNLYDALLNGTGAFADTFSAFAIGNEAQQSITVSGGTLAKPTTLTTSAEGTITGSGLQAAHVAFVGGDVKLTGDNTIGTVAANVRSLSLEETAGKQLTAGEVNDVKGIAATSGDIELTTDQFDIAGDAKLSGKGKLTIAQKTEGVALNIGDNAIKDHGAGALNIKSEWFAGHDKNPAIADGFSHIYLGGGYGDANIDSSTDLHFLDPTTVRSGFEEAVTKSKTTTISGKTHIHLAGTDGIEFMAQKFKMNGTSTIETESGDISITADEVELSSNSQTGTIMTGAQGAAKGGQLNLKTLDENRSIKVGTFAGQIATDALYLDSSYFDASSTTRIFAKGFDAINIGRGAGKGSYEQSGSITFEDTVNVIQGYKNSNAAVKISGKMSFGEKDYNIRSQNVVLSGADIETTTGNVNITTNSLTNDTSQGRNSIKTTQGGKLTLDTFDKEREIHIGKTGTPGLDIDKEWFDTETTTETSIFHGFNEINFGGEDHTGNITINGFEAPKADGTKPSVVNIKTQGDVAQQENGGGLVADKVTIAAGGDVDLTNSENHIKEIGDVTGKKIDIKNNTSTSSKTTETTTITGHIQGETITVQTDGSIKIESSGSLESTTGGVTIDAAKGHFSNENTNPGSQVIKTPDSQRWIIHTDSPEGDNPGTLVPDGIRYNTQDDKEVKNPTGKDYGWDKNVIAYTKPLVVNVISERVYGDGNANFITGDAFKAENANKEHQGTATEQAKYAKLLEALRNDPDKSYKWDTKLTATTAVNTAGGPAAGAIYGNAKEGGIAGQNRQIEYVGDNNLNATVNIDFKIVPRTIKVTAADVKKTYDGMSYTSFNNPQTKVTYENVIAADKNADGSLKSGIITGGAIRYGTTVTAGKSAEGAKDAGNYAIDIQDSNLVSNGNYVFEYQNGTLTIDKRMLAVSAGNMEKVYGTDDPASVSGKITSGSLADGQKSTIEVISAGNKYQNVGEKTELTVKKVIILDADGQDVTKNYNITSEAGSLSVTPREVVVKATDRERVYGEENTKLANTNGNPDYCIEAAADSGNTHTGLVNGATLTELVVSQTDDGIDALSDAGTYQGKIKVSGGKIVGASTANYKITYQDGDIIIKKKKVTVSAVDDTHKYDGTAYQKGNGVRYDGFVGSDTIDTIKGRTGSINYGVLKDSTARNAEGAIHAGTYAIGIQGSDLASTNYDFAYQDGSLTITPRIVKVKVNDAERIYGQSNDVISLTGSVVSGEGYDTLLDGDKFNNYTIASAADEKSDVGTYAMHANNVSLSADSRSLSSDYAITSEDGTLLVKPRPLTLYAGDKSRAFGDDNDMSKYIDGTTKFRGAVTTEASGLTNGDTITDVRETIDARADRKTNAGTAGLSTNISDAVFRRGKASNYDIHYVAGKFSIRPREVLITAGSASRNYGKQNPMVSEYTLTRADGQAGEALLFGDQLNNVTMYYDDDITATTSSGIHKGVIHVNKDWTFSGTSLDNYKFSYAPGNLEVELKGFLPGSPEQIGLDIGTQSSSAHTMATTDGLHDSQKSPLSASVIVPNEKTSTIVVADDGSHSEASTSPVNTMGTMAQPDSIVISSEHGESSAQTFHNNPDGSFEIKMGENKNGSDANGVRVAGYVTKGEGQSENQGGIPVLYTDGKKRKLDGIYTINYSSEALSIMPSSQKVTIPDPSEICQEVAKEYSFMYQSREGSYQVSYGNGIVAIFPQDEISRDMLVNGSKNAGRAVLSTGILSAVQNLGVMPDMIWAIYLFTTLDSETIN